MKQAKDAESLSKLYTRGYYHGDAYDDYSFERLRKSFVWKTKFIRKFCDEGSSLLDIGCALGYFVKVTLNEGFNSYGIDFSEYAVEEARKLVGDRVIRGDVEKEIPFENDYFDVVTAWDLLEHLRFPDLFLKRVGNVLKKNGFLFLSTLNYQSLLSKMMKDRWPFVAPGYHQTHTITTSNLREWLSRAGLRDVSMSTLGLVLPSFSRNCNSPFQKRMAETVERTLRFEIKIMLRLLKPLNLGDTILCVAKCVR